MSAHAFMLALAAGALCVLGLVLWLGARVVRARVKAASALPFQPRPLLNRTEAMLFARVSRLAPRGLAVFPQVQLTNFIRPRRPGSGRRTWDLLNQVIRLSADILVVDAVTHMPLVVIEVDGPTHDGVNAYVSGRKDADARKEAALRGAGVALWRIPVRSIPSDALLAKWLSDLDAQRNAASAVWR